MTNQQEDRLIEALEKIANDHERITNYLLAIKMIFVVALFVMLIVLWPFLSR